MTAIREALSKAGIVGAISEDEVVAALTTLTALEAVAEAARAVAWADGSLEWHEATEKCRGALARLAAVQDGQTPRGGASGNDGTAGIATPDGCAERQSRPGVPRGVCSCPAGSYNPGVHEDYCPHAAEDTR